MNSMKRQNDRTLKEELPRSVGAQHAPRDQWRNNSRKNEGMEPKQKQDPVSPSLSQEASEATYPYLRADKLKTTTTETNQIDHMDHRLV